MVKLLAAGLWVCVITLASVYFSVTMATRKDDPTPVPALLGRYETVRGDITSIPVIRDGGVQGYFLTRLTYTVDPDKMKQLSVPAANLVTDTLYSLLVGNRTIDFPEMKDFDLEAFKADILKALNERIGDEVFHDIIVEQIDYLSKDDIRKNLRQGNLSRPKVSRHA